VKPTSGDGRLPKPARGAKWFTAIVDCNLAGLTEYLQANASQVYDEAPRLDAHPRQLRR
jgi:hypothetical protein